jgi:hypothetical protein
MANNVWVSYILSWYGEKDRIKRIHLFVCRSVIKISHVCPRNDRNNVIRKNGRWRSGLSAREQDIFMLKSCSRLLALACSLHRHFNLLCTGWLDNALQHTKVWSRSRIVSGTRNVIAVARNRNRSSSRFPVRPPEKSRGMTRSLSIVSALTMRRWRRARFPDLEREIKRKREL